MALIGVEGFDNYNSYTDLALRSGALQLTTYNYGGFSATFTIITPGRGGFGKCLQISCAQYNAGWLTVSIDSNLITGYFGAGLYLAAGGTGYAITLNDPLSGSPQVSLYIETVSGSISLYLGDLFQALYHQVPRLAYSGNNAINPTVWNFLEVGAKIDSTAGFVTVQVNGETVLNYGGNTQSTANASFGAVIIAANGVNNVSNGVLQIDDMRINDSTAGPGSYPCSGFMGDLRVSTLFPQSNVSTGWTPLASTNWVEVSETAFDGDTSYNFAPSVGAQDLFSMSALNGLVAYIVGVQITGAYRQTDASAHTVAQQIQIDGSTYTAAAHNLTTSYQFLSDLFVINPATGTEWTVDEINAVIAGYVALS